MTVSINKKNTLYYYLSIILMVLLVAISYYNYLKVKDAEKWRHHTEKVIDKNNEILIEIMTIETQSRGFLLTNNALFLVPFKKSEKKINQKLASILDLTKDNPKQQLKIKQLQKTIENRIEISKLLINNKLTNLNKEQQVAILQKGKITMDTIRDHIKAINAAEVKVLKQKKSDSLFGTNLSEILFLTLILFLLFLLFFINYLFQNHNKKNSQLEIVNSNQKEFSQYTLSLIEASRDPLFTINLEGKITDTNQASVLATGVSKEALLGSDFTIYFTEPEKARKGYKEVFSEGFIVDFPLTIKDHKLTDVLFNGAVYKDSKNVVIGAVVVARDITVQKALEKELIEAKVFAEMATTVAENATEVANESAKSKQQFLSNMSHEIRTPMNAIIGFTKVILKTELTSKQKEYLTAIKMSGDSLIVLINDILDLAKVDAGKMTFEKTPFKLCLSIKAMLHLFESKIQEKNLKLIRNYDAKIPEVLVGDPARLHQIILNLVSNAVKFTSKGSITVSVELISENDDKATIKFSVTDTGIGIKESKIDLIFENFQQATSTTSRLFGGTGLGLAIVKQLVEAQDGTIEVVSEPGKGSTFSFCLEFEKTDADAILEPEIIELNTDIKNIKILVVEDMELNQLLMKTLLDDFGFECEIAANGIIAIEKLQSKTFDVILMDLQMPEMNGFEATKHIREIMKLDLPIIALTADVTTVDVEKCKEIGMNDYISKPVDERLLYSKLLSIIKKPVLIIEEKTEGTITTEKIKYVDMTYMLQLTKANPKLMSELIGVYLKQTPTLVQTMKKSFLDKDWHLLYATIHKMIPSFSIMGMSPEISKVALEIQEYAYKLEHTDDLDQLITTIENACNQSFKELEIELKNLKEEKNEK